MLLLAESNHSFINHSLGDSRQWKYGVVRLVFTKDVILNSNSNVNVSGENALSIESLEGNIVVKTMIDLSCALTELGGKCVGGYMPIDKPNRWSTIIPGKPMQSIRLILIKKVCRTLRLPHFVDHTRVTTRHVCGSTGIVFA